MQPSSDTITGNICRPASLIFLLVTASLAFPLRNVRAQIRECPDGSGPGARGATRVLLLGDSITEGYGSSDGGGYRTFLWNHVQSDSSMSVNFVGTGKAGPESIDRDHESRGGWSVGNIENRINQGVLDACRPNIVLLLIGVNNLGYAPDIKRARRIAGEVRGIMDAILADSTVSHVFAGSYPLHPDKSRLLGISRVNVAAFNDTLSRHVQARRDVAPARISFVDMNDTTGNSVGFEPDDFLEGGLHPSDSGYEKMANVWFAELDSLLGGGDDTPPVCGPPVVEKNGGGAFESIRTYARDGESGISRLRIIRLENLRLYINGRGPFSQDDVRTFDSMAASRINIRAERIHFDDRSSIALRVWNGAGKHIECDSMVTSRATATGEHLQNPERFGLEQNYPNPFNPATTITFRVAEPSHVRLTIYGPAGRLIATPVDARMLAGVYQVTWKAENQPSGVYLYQLKVGSFHEVRKMMLIK